MDSTNSFTITSLKTQAKLLRLALADEGIELGHVKCLHAVARSHRYKNWNAASAFMLGTDHQGATNHRRSRTPLWNDAMLEDPEAQWAHVTMPDGSEDSVGVFPTEDPLGDPEWVDWVPRNYEGALLLQMAETIEYPDGSVGRKQRDAPDCPECNDGHRRTVRYSPERHGHIGEYLWLALDNLLDSSRSSPVLVQRALQDARGEISRWQVAGDHGMDWLPQAKIDFLGHSVEDVDAGEEDDTFDYVPVVFDSGVKKYKALRYEDRDALEHGVHVEWPAPPEDRLEGELDAALFDVLNLDGKDTGPHRTTRWPPGPLEVLVKALVERDPRWEGVDRELLRERVERIIRVAPSTSKVRTLEDARQAIQEFHDKHGRRPFQSDFRSTDAWLRTRQSSLRHLCDEMGLPSPKGRTLEGARQDIQEFHDKHGKRPLSKDLPSTDA